MRAWCILMPPEGSKHKKQSKTSIAILGRPSVLQPSDISFVASESLLAWNRKRGLRFPPNPEENWGPKRRAGISTKSSETRERNQAKKLAQRMGMRQAEKQRQRELHKHHRKDGGGGAARGEGLDVGGGDEDGEGDEGEGGGEGGEDSNEEEIDEDESGMGVSRELDRGGGGDVKRLKP